MKKDAFPTSYRKWAWPHGLPVDGKISGPSTSRLDWNYRSVAVREVGRKRERKFQNPPRNVRESEKAKAESRYAFLNSFTLSVCGVAEGAEGRTKRDRNRRNRSSQYATYAFCRAFKMTETSLRVHAIRGCRMQETLVASARPEGPSRQIL